MKVQLDLQGRHIAFSVGSLLSQLTLQQWQEAALPLVTAVPFTYVLAITTVMDQHPAVMMVPVQQVYPTMGMSWAQLPALPLPQLTPQPIPVPTTQVQVLTMQAQVPPLPTAAPIFTYNVMENAGWSASTGGVAGSALLPLTLPFCSHEAQRQFNRNQQMQAEWRSQRGGGMMRDQPSAAADWVYPAMDQCETSTEIGTPHGSSMPRVPRRGASGRGGSGRGGREGYSSKGCKWMRAHGRRGFR